MADHPGARGPFKPRSNEDLGPDEEQELWEGGYSGKAMIGAWIGAAALTIAAIAGAVAMPEPTMQMVIGGVVLIVWLVLIFKFLAQKLGVRYRLTNHRFFHQKGILSRTTDRIEVIDMDDITFKQGVVERMVNVGSIMITSSDRTSPQLWLHGIEDPARVADLLDKARRAERKRRGVHIEQI